MGVLRLSLEQSERVRNAVSLIAKDAGCRGAGVRLGRAEHLFEQLRVDSVVILLHPQRFREVVLVDLLAFVELAHPTIDGLEHRFGFASAELDLRPFPHVVLRLLREDRAASRSAAPAIFAGFSSGRPS